MLIADQMFFDKRDSEDDAEAMEPVPKSGLRQFVREILQSPFAETPEALPLAFSLSLPPDIYSEQEQPLLPDHTVQRSGFAGAGPKEGCITYKKEGAK